MITGLSSGFVNSVMEFTEKNKKPLSVTLISDWMSRSFYGVLGFEEVKNQLNDMTFFRMKNSGGNDSFMSFIPMADINSIGNLDLRPIVSRAIGNKKIVQTQNTVLEAEEFAVKMPQTHVSYVYFGSNPTRPGYIIDTGDDPDDIFELDENKNTMTVYVNDISQGLNLYYHFYPEENLYMKNTGLNGLGVRISNEDDLSSNVIMM